MFNSKYNWIKSPAEYNEGPIIVEKAGYVPAKIQIENMIMAGQRLVESRKEQYGGMSDGEAMENYDPTFSPNFDMVDADSLFKSIDERAKAKLSTKSNSGASGDTVKTEEVKTSAEEKKPE